MDDLTIPVDDEVLDRLRSTAAEEGIEVELSALRLIRQGLPSDQRANRTPREASVAQIRAVLSEAEREAKVKRILALGRKPKEPFDLKALSDALSDGTE